MRNRYSAITLLVLVLDLVSKWLASTRLESGGPFEIIPGYLSLSLVHNPGVAFGFFSAGESAWRPWVLAAMALAAVVIIFLYMACRRDTASPECLAMMGGILGISPTGSCADTSSISSISHIHDVFYWPTFNIADSAITIGIALLLIDTVRIRWKRPQSSNRPANVKNAESTTRLICIGGIAAFLALSRPLSLAQDASQTVTEPEALRIRPDPAGSFQRTPVLRDTTGQAGVFCKPGLMRWQSAFQKLFVADGRESFLYVPRTGR